MKPLLLALLLLPVTVRAQDLDVTADPVPSGTYEAAGTVSASGVTVATGSDVTFRAGQRVYLGPGFRVEQGAHFLAETDPEAGSLKTGYPVVLDQVPPTTQSSRFYTSHFAGDGLRHPSLSFNGFSCADCGLGYGIEEALALALAQDLNSVNHINIEQALVVRTLLIEASQQPAPDGGGAYEYGELQRNARILEARAFEVLTTYLIWRNGYDLAALGLRSHEAALQSFRALPPLTDGVAR